MGLSGITNNSNYEGSNKYTVCRSVCAGSKYVISGGSDEICKIFDMTKRAEHGTLMHHEVSMSCMNSCAMFESLIRLPMPYRC